MFNIFKILSENKKLKNDCKKLMSDSLRHGSSYGGKCMNARKQELRRNGK